MTRLVALTLTLALALGASSNGIAQEAASEGAAVGGSEDRASTHGPSSNATSAADVPGPATPDGGVASALESARVHFQRGVALYRAGAYDAAFAEFSRAHESAPHYRILYNLAQVQAQRHDYVAALAYFQRYLAEGAGNLPQSRAEEVVAETLELRQRISRLRVETNVDDVRLFVNDMPAVDLPRDEPLPLNAGIHRLRVEKGGYVSVSRTVTLAGGEESTVSLDLVAELEMDDLALAPAAPAPAALPPVVNRTALWSSLAATGALAGASVTFGVLTRRANATLADRLERYPAPRASVEAGRRRVRTFALLADTLGIAAATALGLSTYFYLSPGGPSDDAPSPTGLRAQIGPRASSVSWVGDF
jgi:tetratricopeptide (TPR) repeat protein